MQYSSLKYFTPEGQLIREILSFIAEPIKLHAENRAVNGFFLFQPPKKSPRMPIRVTTKKLEAWHNDLADEIKVEMLNEVAEEFATEAQKELEKLKCTKHPRKISRLTIIADRINTMVIKKTFCCDDFEKKVSIKIER